MCEGRQLDVTFNRVVGSTVGPGVAAEGGPDLLSKLDTGLESGSEHSHYSQKSFGKTSQTQPRSTKSNSNSHRSSSHHHNSSQGHSHAHRHASQGNGSHSGLSARSSVSDILSDKAESAGSVGSRTRGKGRLVTVGQSGSEGSEGKSYPGRETPEQIRSLGSLGGQTDDESF